MRTEVTERRRSKGFARLWGACTFLIVASISWFVLFTFCPLARQTDQSFSQRSLLAAEAFPSWTTASLAAARRFLFWQQSTVQLSPEEEASFLIAYFERLGFVLLSALGASQRLAKWRLSQTPRRLGTHWLGVETARWSEGKDAVANANTFLADGIKRTGAGLKIAPSVALSREQEARSILVIGDRGSGKTVAFWQWYFELRKRSRIRLIVHDTKGDVTARWPDDKVILLAPHDERSWAWAIGRDVIGEVLAREFAIQLVSASDREPNWPHGAQEILVGVIKTLMQRHGTKWHFAHIRGALQLPDNELSEFASQYHKPARTFLSLDADNFTRTAHGYVSTLMAPINRLVSPLAAAWGNTHPDFQLSLRSWLDGADQPRPVLILQRAPDLPNMSQAWIGAAVQCMIRHLIASRTDNNPADPDSGGEVWFVLDEFVQLGRMPDDFFQLLETGRSLNIRAAIGLQNLSQINRLYGAGAADELLALSGSLVALRQNPGPTAKKICEERLTKAGVRDWKDRTVNGKVNREPARKDIDILPQDDLAALAITRDGAQGHLVLGNMSFGLTWNFPITPIQRPGTIRAKWIEF